LDQREREKFFYEIFDPSLPRLGVGDDATTLQALLTVLEARRAGTGAGISTEMEPIRILDIGCGNGPQTLLLARRLKEGTVVALDNHRPFLDELACRACAEGIMDRIELRLKSMTDIGDEDGIFDVVWAEGSLYVMGFKEGLSACFDRLKPGGFAVVSELMWMNPDPPEQCKDFFATEYPAMTDIATNERWIYESGFEIVDRYVQSEAAWWDSYYRPLGARLTMLREEYSEDPERLAMLEGVRAEIVIYERYSRHYVYVMLVLRRPV
jgi:SAM-dependent methyltransferase